MDNNSLSQNHLFQNLLVIFVFVYFTTKVALIGTNDTLPLKTNEQELTSLFGGIVCFILIFYFTNLYSRNLLIPSKSNNYSLIISFVLSFLLTRYLVGKKETQEMSANQIGDNYNSNPVLMGCIMCLIAGLIIMNMFFGSSNSNSSRGYLSYFFFVALTIITIYIFLKSHQKYTVQTLPISTLVLIASFLITNDIETDFISMNFIQIFLMVFFVSLISKFGIHAMVYKNPNETPQEETQAIDNKINISPSFLILITIMSVVFFYFTSKDE